MKKRKLLHKATEATLWKHNYWHNEAVRFAQHIYSSDSIYSFIPKNASSTMRYSIAVENGILDMGVDIRWTAKVSNTWVFIPSLQYQVLNNYTFTILRCPFARLASSFLDQMLRRPHIYMTGWPKENYLRTIWDRPMTRYVNFERFVKKIDSSYKFFYGNGHWIPQFRFLIYDDYDDYFCVEEFGTVVKTLKEKINLDIHDVRKLSNHGIDSLKKVSVPNPHKLSVGELQEMKKAREIVDPKTLFTEEIHAIVKKLYQKDIDLYIEKFGDKNLMFK